MNQSHKDDYTTLLPVFIYPGTEAANSVSGDMDRAIKKASKTIVLHSITAKPDYKKGVINDRQKEFYNKREYNKWIDDAYLLMAKAYLVKGELEYVNNTLRQIIKEYPKENTYTEAQLLLARNLILENEFTESGEILEKLLNDKKFPKSELYMLYAIYGEYYIKRNMPDKAAEKLEIAVQKAPSKQLRCRYTFILGQLYQQTGNLVKATEKYRQVIKMNPPYEMTFNARINMANVYEPGKGNASEIIDKLKKLLADEKNSEYRDQIYYALGNIYLAENDKDKAIENYKLSISSSVNNQQQKAKSYLAIADLKYNDRNYMEAQAYYDSAVINLDEKYPDYEKINNRARNLTSLAKNLQTVTFEDSVRFVAKMSENERNMFIDQIIARVKQQEAEEARRQQELLQEQQNNMMAYSDLQTRNITTDNTSGSTWYFYNLSAKSRGESEFKLKWGNRKLEDNWRRSNKGAIIVQAMEETEDTTSAETRAKDKTKGLSNKTREYYLVNLPMTDSALQASDERIINSLFRAASIYKNELHEYQLAANEYAEIVKRYPDNPQSADALFQLYMLYRQMNNESRANEYKNKLIAKFPESMFAKMLSNPNFVKELQEREKQVSELYEKAYNLYNTGNYQSALQLCNEGLTKYEDNNLKTKFLFLNALCRGKIYGNDTLRTDLAYLVRMYPKTEESSSAKDIIAALDMVHPESKIVSEKKIAQAIYKAPNEDEKHFVVFAINNNLNVANQLNFNLINFNLDNFPKINLTVKIESLANKQLIVVREFNTAKEAMNYFRIASKSPDVIKDVAPAPSIFIISETNFVILQKDQSIETYLTFFNENYKQ
jgi:tetratricopeptide (TPR) repeat protein